MLGPILAASALVAHPALADGPATAGRLADKTLVAWVQLADLSQRGGAALTIQNPAEEFDGLVFGEISPRRWMAGSELHRRSPADQAAFAEEAAGPADRVQLAISYRGKRIAMFRDGRPYAEYEHASEPLAFDDSAIVVLGLRHLAASAPHAFFGAIDEARIYDVALDGPAIAALRPGEPGPRRPWAWWTFDDGKPDDRAGRFASSELRGGARIVDGSLRLEKPGAALVALREKPWREGPESFVRYRPASGKVGDTIPFHWKGEHHVFFLNEDRWDHIVSTNLVDWKELPPALDRGEDPLGPDGEACWTGSIVEHRGTFHLFYTGKNARDPAGDQKVMAATSTDLVRWEKQPGRTFYADGGRYWGRPRNGPAEPVIYHHQAFRDPDVFFHEGEGRWWMLLHALTAADKKPCIGLYTSADLRAWAPREPLAVYDASLSLDCPHAAPIGDRWFIIAADTSYAAAPAPGGPYPAGMEPYDAGDLFVPKSLSDGERRIIWGWVRDLEGGKDRGKPLWGGTMSMPREIFADSRGRLGSRIPAEVAGAYSRTALDLAAGSPLRTGGGGWRHEGGRLIAGESGGTCRLEAPADYLLDASVRLDPGSEFALVFRRGEAEGSGYPLTLRPESGRVEIRRGDSTFSRAIDLDASRPVAIQALVRGSIIECFIDGRHALTCRAYDHPRGGLGLVAARGKVEVQSLRIRTAVR